MHQDGGAARRRSGPRTLETTIHIYLHTYTCIHASLHTYIHTYVCIHYKDVKRMCEASGTSPQEVILGGLRLLFALLPRCESRWEAEILKDEDCGLALRAMGANGHATRKMGKIFV